MSAPNRNLMVALAMLAAAGASADSAPRLAKRIKVEDKNGRERKRAAQAKREKKAAKRARMAARNKTP